MAMWRDKRVAPDPGKTIKVKSQNYNNSKMSNKIYYIKPQKPYSEKDR